jgi:hypothetical protein
MSPSPKKKPAGSCLNGTANGAKVGLWLNSCDVSVQVRGDVCAEVTVTQTFANHLDVEVKDGSFSFPLINGIAVFDFEAKFADKVNCMNLVA